MYDFDVDLAATERNALCDKWLSPEVDALSVSWGGRYHCGFCNPPYSCIKPWLSKAIDQAEIHNHTSVFLIPPPNGELLYGDYVFGHASEVIFITGRLSFIGVDGKPTSGNPRGSMVVVYRANDLGDTRYRHIYNKRLLCDFS